MKKHILLISKLLPIILSVFPFELVAQSGALDISFNGNGIVTTNIGTTADKAFAITTQSDGKIVVAGESRNGTQLFFSLTRYNTDGSLDTSFDNDGIVTTQYGSNDYWRAIAIQADGKIVTAGYSVVSSQFVFALARYNTNGSLDNSFDNDGIVITAIGNDDYARAVAIQSDGKILVTGYSDNRFVIARYNTNGSLDNTFDNDGIVTTIIGTNNQANALDIQTDGKILIGGYCLIGSQNTFVVARYNTNGSLDISFDSDGISTVNIGPFDDRAYAIDIQSDGKIVLAGQSDNGFLPVFALARFNPNGSLDNNFDNDGVITTNIVANDRVFAMSIQADGKIVVGGCTYNGTQYVFALARYNSNGSLDNSFGNNGKVLTQVGTEDYIYSIALQSDGKILAAGYSHNGVQFVYAVVRYNNCANITFSQSLSICAGQSLIVGSNSYSSSGTYTDTLIAANTCDSIITTNLTVNAMPIITTYLSGTTIISNQNGANYQWIECNNNNQPIQGETNQSFTAVVNGSYAVIVYFGSCFDTSSCVNIFNVGIDQNSELNEELLVFPNPFLNSTTIQTNEYIKNATITIYNSLGEQVKEIKNVNGQSIILNRENLPIGVYSIQLKQDNTYFLSKRVIIIE